jgi:hypothetical protein
MNKIKIFNMLLALFPLFIGGLIYICFRNEDILFFSWMRFLNINYSLLRQIELKNNIISSYIVFSLPNGLWVLSGLLLLKVFLENEKRLLAIYSIIFIMVSILYEISQLIDIIPGTFDIADIITIIIFSNIGLFVNIYRKNIKNK